MDSSSSSLPASQRIPNEILLPIIAQCSPSALAAFSQTSFAFLEVASPLLYTSVTLSNPKQAALFFSPPHVFPSYLSRIELFTSRTQTKHLITDLGSYDTSRSLFTPPTGPLLLDSYSDWRGDTCFMWLVNPSLCSLQSNAHAQHNMDTFAQITDHPLHRYGYLGESWDRLEDLVFSGWYPNGEFPRCREGPSQVPRLTLDLAMIEQSLDSRKPKGSCQRVLLEGFAKSLGGRRGRVWVRSEEMREMFKVAKEEVVKRLNGSKLGQEVGEIRVDIKEPTSL